MKEWGTILLNAALFKTETYEWVSQRRDAFYRGFLTIIAIALIAGLPILIGNLIDDFKPGPAPGEVDRIMSEIEGVFRNFAPMAGNMDMPDEALDAILSQIREGVQVGVDAEARISELPRLLPAPIGDVFESFGAYASRPFSDTALPLTGATLGTWLGYGIWVMLFAKLLSGRSTLVGFFGTTALFSVPFLLTFFRFIPVLGPIIGVAAFIWGLAIYIKATAVSHQFGYGKAFLAVFLPMLILAGLVVLFGGGIATLIAASSAGN